MASIYHSSRFTSEMEKAIFKIGPNEERYLTKDFTEIFIEQTIFPIADSYGRLFCDDDYPEHLCKQYDITKDPYQSVVDYNTLHLYMQKFLEMKEEPYIYGVRNHPGPLSRETYLIQNELLQFFNKGYITVDSEAGILAEGVWTKYNIQRPYLFIMGEKKKIQKMYDAIAHDTMISAIDYNVNDEMKCIFKHFTSITPEQEQYIRDNYTFGFFGIRYPDQIDYYSDECQDYLEYIFSNQFFVDLLSIS